MVDFYIVWAYNIGTEKEKEKRKWHLIKQYYTEKKKENLITEQKQSIALVEIMGLVLTALQTDFIKIKKDC